MDVTVARLANITAEAEIAFLATCVCSVAALPWPGGSSMQLLARTYAMRRRALLGSEVSAGRQ
jgi:hypothetical protein